MVNLFSNYFKQKSFFQVSKFTFLLFAHLGAGASLVLINIFLANNISQTQFGIFIWIYAASMVMSQMVIFGSSSYYLNKKGHNYPNTSLFFNSGPSFIIFNFIFICIFTLFCITLFNFHANQYTFLGFFISLILVQICQEMHILRCQLKNLYKLQSLIFLTPHASRFAALIIALNFFQSLSFKSLILFLTAINFLIFCLLTFKWRALIASFFLSINFKKYLQHFKNVNQRGIAEASFMLYTQLPVILVAYVFSIEESGIFAISITFATIFLLPSAVFTKAFSPVLFKEANKTKKLHFKIVVNFLYFLGILGFFMGSCLYFLSEFIVVQFIDESFVSSIELIKILSVYIFVRYLYTAISYSMYTHTFSIVHARILLFAIALQLIFFYFAAHFSLFNLSQVAWMMCVIELLIFFISMGFLKSNAFKLT